MKAPADALAELARRLEKTWSQVVTGAAWATDIRLGSSGLTGQRLAEVWDQVHPVRTAWLHWAESSGPGVDLEWRDARLHRSEQPLPSVLRVADIDTAARLLQDGWPARLAQGRSRATRLADDFPHHPDPAGILRATRELSDVNFDLVVRAARWFADPHPAGLTARQVPVEGMGTKWLGHHGGVVRRLAGPASLDLEPGRPSRVHLTYLDPTHLDSGGRRHDVATMGDVDVVAYQPRLVLISENRDTAQQFPRVPGGIAIEGDGNGPGAIPSLGWVRACPDVVYWGDMDAKGLEILASFRAAGLPVRSMFMDMTAYRRWQRFGVDHNHNDTPLGPRPARAIDLEPGERELYEALCSPEWPGHRRIEQERIPLDVAGQALDVRD
ncbi:Wadjet anti-phage system protein JetD domain-containing protein [Nocardioides caeni]|uniref:DUF3322 and DUF2220 domain-containing protein n=1 Tax=Nocardioides caeni TaxID=574700 RepID=UPI0013053AB1|nr:DUF3322 and DUF2220 domain-containing protein [Nocardioides caeni]